MNNRASTRITWVNSLEKGSNKHNIFELNILLMFTTDLMENNKRCI